MTENRANSKVLFRVPEEDGSANVETLWASDLGGDRYRLENSPFYAYSVSWQDVIRAPFNESEEFPTFQEVVEKSGHKTVRIFFEEEVSSDNTHLEQLASLGCSYEGANKKYFAIDIPPEVSLDEVRKYLIASALQWEHGDPSYSELYPDDV